jgi:hypothetical protein
VAQQQAGRSRTLGAVMTGARTTLRSFSHALHQLWLEVPGPIFLLMAVFGSADLVHEYIKYHAGNAPASRVMVAICFTLAFAWFGVSSFWRTRRKRQRS